MAKAWRVEGLTRATPVDEAAEAILRVKLGELRHHAALAVKRVDIEDLHATRVASRRLRAALGLVGGPLADLEPGVRRLGTALGQVRDCDVTIEWLERMLVKSLDVERPGIERLLAARRAELPALEQLAREALTAFEAHVALPIELRIEEAGWPGSLDGKRVRGRLTERMEVVARRIARLEERGLGDTLTAHALRIAGKKARYDLELVEDIFPEAREALVRLKQLQELVGELHDADVHLAFLPAYVASVELGEQAGAVRLLRDALRAREKYELLLVEELDAWRGGALARALGAAIGDGRGVGRS